jgi:hypothetical protein
MGHPKANMSKPSRDWFDIFACKPWQRGRPPVTFFVSPQSQYNMTVHGDGSQVVFVNASGHERRVTLFIEDL